MITRFKEILKIFIVSYLVAACVGPLATENKYKGKLSNEQLDEIAVLIEETELDPISTKSEELRFNLSIWLVKSPDITVKIYDTLELSDDYVYKQLFTTQAMLLSAKYIIRNPTMKNAHLDIQVQTLEGLLDIYDKIISEIGDSAKTPSMESLVQKRDDGELEEYVQVIITKVGDG